MKKKDYYISYNKNSHRRHTTRHDRTKRTALNKKGRIAVMLFLIAILLGTAALLLKNKLNQNVGEQESNAAVQNKIEEVTPKTAAGPYGMWITEAAAEEEILEPEPDQEVWMSNFVDEREKTRVKGIYVTAAKANNSIDNLVSLVEDSELNTMVIDIKDDDGRITYEMDYEDAIAINSPRPYITDIDGLIKKLKEKNIYLIARIVTFKDPILADARPELALKKKDGSVFRDKDGQAWVNPFNHEVWDYLVGVAAQCAKIGFDEVNFDYIRFSTDSGMSSVDFGEDSSAESKIDAVTGFVKYACEQLKPLGLFVSADVYGAIISSSVDAKIVGQSYVEMSKYLDYICPMIYPSHYGNGYYGLDYPDTHPYELVMGALKSSKTSLSQIAENEHCAVVRPWLQDFTASWLKHYISYGSKEVRTQIEAVYDSGYDQWLLWNGGMNYTQSALYTEEMAAFHYENRPTPTPTPTPTPEPLPTRVPNQGKYYDSPWKKDDES